MKKSFLLIIIVFIGIIFLGNYLGKNDSANKKIKPNVSLKELNVLKDNGLLIEINPQLNEAFVNSEIWYLLDYRTKENAGRIMAFYCGQEKGTNLNWVDIKDSYTGKKLAKYSESWGFKTY